MKSKSIAILIAVVLVLGLTSFAVVRYKVFQKYISLGLDLQGGVHVVLEAVDTPEAPIKPDSIDRVKAIIENRVNQFGVKEPIIQKQGNNRLIVELAGVKDADNAIDLIGRTAQLKFVTPDNKVVLQGADLKDAQAATNPTTNEHYVALKFNDEGAKKFADITTELVRKYPNSNDPNRVISIYLDKDIVSSPFVREPITTGDAQISGGFATLAEANQLAVILRSGALPVVLEKVAVQRVGPTIGADSLAKSTTAGIVGVSAVLLFMLLFYRLPGLIANLALGFYILILLGIFAALHVTLTLPGIAGFLLSIGIAVDANVIIFERIKEEIREGNSLRRSIENGFTRGFTAIFDANATVIITALVLYYFGTGTIKGFAITLGAGVFASLFTAVTLTKWMLRLTVDAGIKNKKLYGVQEG
ncbi:MAG: protein translocase subunit SecD [Thermincola sp.]|jgi:preprotein translocase subunit SecD|nr:protein translocase subunit SecD [Thermincola sp.]MDT3702664.1 protein translocase subunit SecD [Thermincola sp.]